MGKIYLNITINEQALEHTEQFKYLGSMDDR